MGVVAFIFLHLAFGFCVGMGTGFLWKWKEIVVHLLLGLLAVVVLVSTGALLLTGEAGNSDPILWYEWVGYALYAVGIWFGIDAGEIYYDELVEAYHD